METPPPSSVAEVNVPYSNKTHSQKLIAIKGIYSPTVPNLFQYSKSREVAGSNTGSEIDFKIAQTMNGHRILQGQTMYPFRNKLDLEYSKVDPFFHNGTFGDPNINVNANLIGTPLGVSTLEDPRLTYTKSILQLKEHIGNETKSYDDYLKQLFMLNTEKGLNYYYNQLQLLDQDLSDYSRTRRNLNPDSVLAINFSKSLPIGELRRPPKGSVPLSSYKNEKRKSIHLESYNAHTLNNVRATKYLRNNFTKPYNILQDGVEDYNDNRSTVSTLSNNTSSSRRGSRTSLDSFPLEFSDNVENERSTISLSSSRNVSDGSQLSRTELLSNNEIVIPATQQEIIQGTNEETKSDLQNEIEQDLEGEELLKTWISLTDEEKIEKLNRGEVNPRSLLNDMRLREIRAAAGLSTYISPPFGKEGRSRTESSKIRVERLRSDLNEKIITNDENRNIRRVPNSRTSIQQSREFIPRNDYLSDNNHILTTSLQTSSSPIALPNSSIIATPTSTQPNNPSTPTLVYPLSVNKTTRTNESIRTMSPNRRIETPVFEEKSDYFRGDPFSYDDLRHISPKEFKSLKNKNQLVDLIQSKNDHIFQRGIKIADRYKAGIPWKTKQKIARDYALQMSDFHYNFTPDNL